MVDYGFDDVFFMKWLCVYDSDFKFLFEGLFSGFGWCLRDFLDVFKEVKLSIV